MNTEAITLLSGIQVLLLTVISYFIKRYLSEQDEYRKKTEADLREIKHNYLDRFDKVNDNIHKLELSIKDELRKFTQ